MIRSIAITTDFSEASKAAFSAAASLAKKFEARLFVLHLPERPQVFVPWQAEPAPAEIATRRESLQRKLEGLVKNAPELAGVRAEPVVLQGENVDTLCEFLEKEHIDVTAISTHGHSGVGHFLLGSFTVRFLQFAPCPVLVFRTLRESEGAPPRTFQPARILFPYDFSRPSKGALDSVRSWARAFDASVKLLFVVHHQLSPDEDPALPSRSVAEYYEKRQTEALERLEVVAKTELKDIPTHAVVRIGHPAREILREAEEFRAGLIVMASRGLSVLDRVALGSVAERVIQGASCPVLVTRKP